MFPGKLLQLIDALTLDVEKLKADVIELRDRLDIIECRNLISCTRCVNRDVQTCSISKDKVSMSPHVCADFLEADLSLCPRCGISTGHNDGRLCTTCDPRCEICNSSLVNRVYYQHFGINYCAECNEDVIRQTRAQHAGGMW
jgi:hypothetical protein